jgi:hypothetical protein
MRERTLIEPNASAEYFGLLAEFDGAEKLLESAKRARKARFRQMDAYSPFPIEGLAEILGFQDNRVPIFAAAGGILGALLGYGMQAYTIHAFPIDIGARPLFAQPASALITFELAVLGAVLCTIGGMIALNRLPRFNHPVFEVDHFHLASSDKFFLIVFSNDSLFDPKRTRRFLESLKPVRVTLIERTEQPE